MTQDTPTTGTGFWIALAHGLGWGVLAASICGGATMAFASLAANTPGDEALRLTFETLIWTALGATIVAIFPIGPIAGVIGWLIYSRGVRSPWAYALLGALSALAAPVLIAVIGTETMRYRSDANLAVLSDASALLFLGAFIIIGAFAGFMAGRKLRG